MVPLVDGQDVDAVPLAFGMLVELVLDIDVDAVVVRIVELPIETTVESAAWTDGEEDDIDRTPRPTPTASPRQSRTVRVIARTTFLFNPQIVVDRRSAWLSEARLSSEF